MNNTARVFKELRENWRVLIATYKADEMVAVGIRFASGEVRSARSKFEQLPELLHLIFEYEHQSTADKKDDNILSVYICDKTGTTFYDSNEYRPSKNKYNLKRDGDKRVTKFTGMLADDREQVVNLTLEQIHSHIDEISADDDLDKGETVDSPWGDMPW